MLRLSVVIPCYNEKETISAIVDRVRAVPLDTEIILVDDFSTDGTRAVIDAEVAHKVDRLIYHDQNRGKGAALRSGFQAATGDLVIVQDADLEYDPQEYPILMQPILDGKADVVYGSRFMTNRPHRVLFFWHSLGNRFLTLVSNMMTNLNLSDMETCYKMFRREVIQNITVQENRFGFEPEITAKIAKLQCRIYEVGISYSGRSYAEGKKIGWRDGARALYCVIKYNLRRGPRMVGELEKHRSAGPGFGDAIPVQATAPSHAVDLAGSPAQLEATELLAMDSPTVEALSGAALGDRRED